MALRTGAEVVVRPMEVRSWRQVRGLFRSPCVPVSRTDFPGLGSAGLLYMSGWQGGWVCEYGQAGLG